MRRWVIVVLVGFALAAPAAARAADSVPEDVQALARDLVGERDVELVLNYLREALGAVVDGRQPPSGDELARRAEAIGEELKRRGVAAGRAVLDALELAIRRELREPQRLPPSSPSRRT